MEPIEKLESKVPETPHLGSVGGIGASSVIGQPLSKYLTAREPPSTIALVEDVLTMLQPLPGTMATALQSSY